MKFAFKSIVVAAAFVAAGVANAASVSVVADGTTVQNGFTVTALGELEFSSLLMGALNTPNPPVAVSPYGGATLTEGTRTETDEFGGTTETPYHIVGSKVTGLTYDDVSGKVTNVISIGGAAQSMAKNTAIGASGGQAKVGELDVRFQADGSVNIFGLITGQRLGAATGVNYSGLLFTVSAANVTGATTFQNAAGVYETTLNNLALSDAGFNALVQSLGLSSTGLGFSALKQATANFGNLNSTITVVSAGVTPAVPEPSTYALMGVGLIGLGLVARRRAK